MADEVTTTDETPTEPVVEPEITPEVTPGETHPLEPGGKRFAEVYGEMKDARREAQELRERLARVEGQVAAKPVTPVPQPQFYTPQVLQAAVDTGKITPAQMADQLAWQRAEEMRVRVDKDSEQRIRTQSALSEINSYIEKAPSLRDSRSPEFERVARAAREIAEEIGRGVDDPLVQRRALREALGPLDRLAKVRAAVDTARGMNNMDTETRGAGGQSSNTSKVDPLKDVPQMYKDHWDRLGYSQERRIAEAKFIKPRRQR